MAGPLALGKVGGKNTGFGFFAKGLGFDGNAGNFPALFFQCGSVAVIANVFKALFFLLALLLPHLYDMYLQCATSTPACRAATRGTRAPTATPSTSKKFYYAWNKWEPSVCLDPMV